MGPPLPLVLLSVLLIAGGLILALRALWRLGHAVRCRMTRGAPYAAGQIADRLLGFAMTLPVAPLGAALLLLAFAQAAFQATSPGEPVRVGRIDARRSGWSRTSVELAPDPLYPERGLLRGSIDGARWAVGGDFLVWAPGVRWLGLRPAQRVGSLLGSGDPNGTSAASQVTVIDAPPRAARLLLEHARWVPFLTVRRGTSAWFAPADRAIVVLYATTEGYIADTAAAGAR